MTFEYSKTHYEVEIIRKNNKNTYIRVKNNKIYITTNYFVNDRKIKKLLEENKKSIIKMLERSKQIEQKNESFLLFGKSYDIIFGDFKQQVTIEDKKILAINEEVFNKWLNIYIYDIFFNHLIHLHSKFDKTVPYPDLKIRKMKTRWGVCNIKNKSITLNLDLFHYDIECLDYVIIHELSHFLVQNHSKDFWKVVEKFCPNYKEIRKKLRS